MILRYAPTLALFLAVSGFVWWVVDLRSDNAALRAEVASQVAELAALQVQADLSRQAAEIAQWERDRAAVAAAKYEAIRDAFRKGDFNAPLPDDFRHLVLCLLRRSTTGENPSDCPGHPR